MKKRIRKTGEIVDIIDWFNFHRTERDKEDTVSYVDSKGVEHHNEKGMNLWWDFEDIGEIPSTVDWEQRRYEIANDCIKVILGNDEMIYLAKDAGLKRGCRDIPTNIAEMAVSFADALIAKLNERR